MGAPEIHPTCQRATLGGARAKRTRGERRDPRTPVNQGVASVGAGVQRGEGFILIRYRYCRIEFDQILIGQAARLTLGFARWRSPQLCSGVGVK